MSRDTRPNRAETKAALLQLIQDQGGSILTTDHSTGQTVYDLLADQFGLSERARTERSVGSRTQTAWRSAVGYARLDLVREGLLKKKSGRGRWTLTDDANHSFLLPEEFKSSKRLEGALTRVLVNKYERDPANRRDCIAHYGPHCQVCGMTFGKEYGPSAEGFIHVHHLRPLAKCGKGYKVDAVKDLRPVCPNCHAVIHLGGKCRKIEEVKRMLK